MQPSSFDTTFAVLTDAGRPFPWLCELFKRFISDDPNNTPESCNIPTGLGKTSVVARWLITLASWTTDVDVPGVHVAEIDAILPLATISVATLNDFVGENHVHA